MLDYNKNITRENIDRAKYESKFKFVDSVLDNPSPPDEPTLANIWNDPTTFAYYFFKNERGGRLKLYPYQDLVLNDPHQFIYCRWSNQTGKSLGFDVKGTRNLIIDHGFAHNEAIVSKSLPQSTFQMRRVKSLLNSMTGLSWKLEKGAADSMSVITKDIMDKEDVTYTKEKRPQRTKYTNMLVCAPCTEGLLGYDLHDLNLDEFEYWDVDQKYFFNQIAQPRTYHTNGKIMVTTNPNGQHNYGADLENQLLKDRITKKWHTYIFNYLDKPGATREQYEQWKFELPRQEFESTVAAIRSLSEKNYFTPDEIDRSFSEKLRESDMVGQQPYFFLDVGSTQDQCCLVGGFIELGPDYDSSKEMRYNRPHIHLHIPIIHLYPVGYPLSRVAGSYDEKQDSDGWHYEKSIMEYLNDWKVGNVMPYFGYDVTGNKGMIPLFRSQAIEAADVVFSGPLKSGYYQRFKYMMEKGLIHRPKHKIWIEQAGKLVATKGARGYLLINSGGIGKPSQTRKEASRIDSKLKKIPDDCMDATAGLISLADPVLDTEPTLRFFK